MVFLSGAFPLACATALVVSSSAVHVASALTVVGDAKQYGVTYIDARSGSWGGNPSVGKDYYSEDVRQIIAIKGQEYDCVRDNKGDVAFTFIGRVSFQVVTKDHQTVWVGPYGNEPQRFYYWPHCLHLNATDFEFTNITRLSFGSNNDQPIGKGSVGPFDGVGKAVHGSGGTRKEKPHNGTDSTSTTTILLATLLCLSCLAIVVLSVLILLMRRRRDAGSNGTAHEEEGDSSASDGGYQPLNYGGAEGGDDQEKHAE